MKQGYYKTNVTE